MKGGSLTSTSVSYEPLPTGTVLSDKYELLGVLGRGGMGVVYVGRHLKLGRRVAIKTLVPDTKLDTDACIRFEREARAAASLKSRFVASVEDVETLPDGAPYMVMELLEGSPLDAELETRGRLEVGEAVDFIL
jgi:serine/threonine-protein kinase